MNHPWSKWSFPSREGIREKRLLRHVEMAVPPGDEGAESEEEISQTQTAKAPAQKKRAL
jgi:hypothetical protein